MFDAKNVKHVVEETINKYQQIDVLINNAATAVKGTITSLEEKERDRQLSVNLKSIYLFSHLIIPSMTEQRNGVILNIGSVTSLVGVKDYATYVAPRAGILGITRAMALDHTAEDIRENCICPSGIKTPLMKWQFGNAPDPELERKRVIDLHPVSRMAKLEELADLFVYLVSDNASLKPHFQLRLFSLVD